MAAIIKTASGKFRAQIRRKGISVAKSFPTKGEAKRWATTQEYSIDREAWHDPGLLRDRTLLDVIAGYRAKRPVSRAMATSINNLDFLYTVPLSRLTPEKVAEFAEYRISTHEVKPQTVAIDVIQLSVLLNFARLKMKLPIDSQLIKDARVELKVEGLIAPSNERSRRPTADELDNLMNYWGSLAYTRFSVLPMGLLVKFAIYSCMRQSEITRLLWEDFNEDTRCITIRDRKHPTKKQGNDQEVPLLGDAFEIVMRQPRDSDRVFPYEAKSISSNFTRTCKKLNIKNLRFHDLRREGCSRLLEADYSLSEVALVSGHRDINVLHNIYTALNAENIHRGIKRNKAGK